MSCSLPFPTLMLVTNSHRSRRPIVEAVVAAVAAGVDLVQLREPDLSDSDTRRLAIELVDRIGTERLIINGRPELARELGTGLHLRDGQQPPDRNARRETRSMLGRSVHGPSRDASADSRADYLLAGNVFETRTHPGRAARGTGWLREVVGASDMPILAIGGITVANVGEVMTTGCDGIAVINAILAQDDPSAAAVALRHALNQTWKEHRVDQR